MPIKKIAVRLGERSYNIFIGRNVIDRCGRIVRSLRIGTDAFVVTNPRVSAIFKKRIIKSLAASGISARFALIADSEKAKSINSAEKILESLSRYDINKRVFIIALGGGVVGDLAGFVASVYKRGIPYIQIPTTLLAQVDSSIGGKVAVDLRAGKNLAGSVYQPKAVITDISSLKTLPERQVRNGLSEAIKYGAIKDAVLFSYIENNLDKILHLDMRALERVVSASARIKAAIVKTDEFDKKGFRAILNYGHTIGHAIEAAAGYSCTYNHGEAIALGMLAASSIAADIGIIRPKAAIRIASLIKRSGLPTSIKGVSVSRIHSSHLHDKKFTGSRNRFILISDIGRARIKDGVPDAAIRNALAGLSGR